MAAAKCSYRRKGHTSKSFLCCLRCGRIPSPSSIDSSSSEERTLLSKQKRIKQLSVCVCVDIQPLVCSKVASTLKEPKTCTSSPFVTYASKTSLH